MSMKCIKMRRSVLVNAHVSERENIFQIETEHNCVRQKKVIGDRAARVKTN